MGSSISGGYFIGSMLGRIFGPAVNDFIEFETTWGRKISQKKIEKERRSKEADLEDKFKLAKLDQQHKLEILQIQFEQNRKRAEEQMVLSLSEWKEKVFWEKCFPLRNPFEMPLGVELKYKESKDRVKGNKYSIKTIKLPDGKEIVPLRLITALKDTTTPHASTINGDLSMFLAQYYSANSEHSVVSDIGAWKDEAPINDASINYLFRGQKGLPTLIMVPTYTNGGAILRMKLWSWGLGEELSYPVCFDFGWFNLEVIYKQMLLEEIKSFDKTLTKIKAGRPTPYRDFENGKHIVEMIEKGNNINDVEREQLLSLLQRTPPELASIVQRKTNDVVSTMYACSAAMYADGYHLCNYGTLPLLPYILPRMPGAKMFVSQIQQYYQDVFKISLSQGKLSYVDAIGVESDMYENFRRMGSDSGDLKKLAVQIRGHVFDIKDNLSDEDTINKIDSHVKMLLQ